MIQLFKRANDKAGAEVDPKDPTKQKWNGDSIFVQIDNEMVSLSELAKHSKENAKEFEPIQIEGLQNEIEIDGQLYNTNDLVERYKTKKNEESKDTKKADPDAKSEEARKKDEEAKNKKNAEEEEMKKKEEEAKNKKNAEDEEKKKEEEETLKKNAEEKAKKDDEDIANKNGKKNTKDMKHFISLSTARENGTIAATVTIDTLHNRIDRGKSRYGADPK